MTARSLCLLFSLLVTFAIAAEPSGYIVGLPDGLSPAEVKSVAAALEREHGVKVVRTFTAALNGLHVQATDAAAKKLAGDPRVVYVEENAAVTLTADSKVTRPVDANPTDYAPGWSLQRITHRDRLAPGAEGTYPSAGDGAGIIAYVFDSGVWADHPDLHGRVEAGYDTFIPGSSTLAHAPCPVDPQIVEATRDACPPGACLAGGHGTMAASLIGGTTFGIAPGVTIVPVRATDCAGNGEMANLIAGLDWVIREHLPAPDAPGFNGAVINMSIHMRRDVNLPEVRSLKAALTRVIRRGAVVVTAAGNTALDACGGYPSGFAYGNGQSDPHVISVSGVNHTDTRDCTSVLVPPVDPCTGPLFGVGRCVDLFAPAVDMRGAGLREGGDGIGPMRLTAREGTSWASPQAAGAAARLLAENAGTGHPLYRSNAPHETSDNVWRVLRDNATVGVVQDPGPDSANRLLYIGAIDITSQPRPVVTRGDEGTTPLTIAVANPPAGTTYSWRRGTFADFTVVQESSNPTYNAPANETASYWVRVSYPHTPAPVTADSVLATVTHCAFADALPVITATPIDGNSWRLQVAADTDATKYEWFVGAPGDVSQPVATTTVPQADVHPLSTTDYWVRVTYPACGTTIDSANYATTVACDAPRILSVPEGSFVLGTQPGDPDRPFTLDVVAEGTSLTYQWYRVDGGVAAEIPNATGPSLTLNAAGGMQTVFVRVTSRCGAESSVDGPTATVSWVGCDVAFAMARHPNRFPDAHNNQMTMTNISPPIVFVPMGRSIALTARAVKVNRERTDAAITWVEGTEIKQTGGTFFIRNIGNSRTTRTLAVRMAQRGSPDCQRVGFVRVASCGAEVLPLITRFPVSDATGVARLEVREAKGVIVEWRTGEHDDTAPAFVERLQPGDHDSTRTFPPGTRYWARVTADDVCNPDEAEITEDTEVYTAQACGTTTVVLRDPATGAPVNVGNGHTINVAPGGAVALSTTTPDIHWSDALGGQSGSTYFSAGTNYERLVTLESPSGCFAGSVTIHPTAGCKPLIRTAPISTTAPRDGKATLSVTVDPSYANATIEWWEGEHDSTGEPVARNVTSYQGDTGKTYWVRVIATCGNQSLVEDSALAAISCSNCRTRSVRH